MGGQSNRALVVDDDMRFLIRIPAESTTPDVAVPDRRSIPLGACLPEDQGLLSAGRWRFGSAA